jgi:hypothetical protein
MIDAFGIAVADARLLEAFALGSGKIQKSDCHHWPEPVVQQPIARRMVKRGHAALILATDWLVEKRKREPVNRRLLLSKTAVSQLGERRWRTPTFTQWDLSEYQIAYLFVDGIAERLRPGAKREPVLAGPAASDLAAAPPHAPN